jgi:hypothetical protein
MLVRLHQVAQKLVFFRPLSIILAIASLFLSIYCLLIDNTFTARALEPSIVTALWGLLLFAYLQLFQSIPPPVLPHDSFLKKLNTKLKLALYSLLAFIVIVTTILLFWMSLRLLIL